MQATGNETFRALSDPTRRRILILLGKQEMTIAQVVEEFTVTRAAIKKHLVILEQGNLISVRVRGRERINRLNPDGLRPVAQWLNEFDQFWDDHLGKLKTVVESEQRKN